MQQAVGEGGVAAGAQTQMQVGPLRGGRQAGVGDNQFAAVGALPLKVLHQRRHRLGGIAAGQQDDAGAGDVVQRKRQPPVQAQSADAGSGGRRHTKTPVVVNVGGLQRHAGELAQQVALFISQRTAAENPDGVGAVSRPRFPKRRRNPPQRIIPTRRMQDAGGAPD